MEESNFLEYLPLLLFALIGIVSSFRKKKTDNQEQEQRQIDNESVKPDRYEDDPYQRESPGDIQMPPSPWRVETSPRVEEMLDRYEPGDEGVAMTGRSVKTATPNLLSLKAESIEFKSLSIEEYLKEANSKEGAEKQYDYDDHKLNNNETFKFDPKMAFVYSEIMKPKFKE